MQVSSFGLNYFDSNIDYIDHLGWKIPKVISSLDDEYNFVTKAVAIIDRTHLGVIKVFGKDALDLLERLSTNRLVDLEIGSGVSTVLTSHNGKMVDLLKLSLLNDSLLMTVSSGHINYVLEWIEKYTFDEDVVLNDISEFTSVIGVVGPNSKNILEEWAECDLKFENLSNVCISKYGHEVIICRTDLLDEIGFEVFFPNIIAEYMYNSLMSFVRSKRVKLIGEQAFEIARIQAKVPKWGNELTNEYNPLEANLNNIISWTKGCYIGQEVVARLHNYEKVKQHLVGFSVSEISNIIPGDRVIFNDQNVGIITSASSVPGSEKTIAMGYIRAKFINESKDLHLSSGISIDLDNDSL